MSLLQLKFRASLSRWVLPAAWLLCCSVPCRAQGAQEELNDLSGRVEYAFYAGDVAALLQATNALENLPNVDAQREALQTELSFARWKLSQLQRTDNRSEAEKTAEACANAEPFKINAQQQAFTAACLSLLEELRPWRSRWYRNAREERIKQAQMLNAKSAQVQFVSAWIQAQHEPAASGTYAALKQSIASFDSANSLLEDRGHAEALYLLGKLELGRHNSLAARNALEQALVLAPDYRDARALLDQLTMK